MRGRKSSLLVLSLLIPIKGDFFKKKKYLKNEEPINIRACQALERFLTRMISILQNEF